MTNAPSRPAWAAGLDLTILAHRQSYVVRRVREGIPIRQATAEVFISAKTVQHWRDRTPGFAERLAAMFTGPAADRMAEAWAAEMYARREEIQARVAAQAAARVAEKKAAEARRRRRQPGGEADGAGAAWMERLP